MRALFEERFEAFATQEVLAEYHLALHSQSVRAGAQLAQLHPNSVLDYEQAVSESIDLVAPGPSFQCADPDDVKFTAASTGAHADYLVTSDAALLALEHVLEAWVITPEQFLAEVIETNG